VRIVVDGELQPVRILETGPDPQLAAYQALPDHRWGRLVVGGELPRDAESVALAVWPPILPATFTVERPWQPPVERFVSWSPTGLSAAIPLDGLVAPQGAWPVLRHYLASGWHHVLPAGLDHLLFVLALALLTPRLAPLLLQLTMFTLAHTITLGLVAFEVLSVRSGPVEALIALSIAAVALENRRRNTLSRWRLPLVFAFGLVHGLGFGGAFTTQRLPEGQGLLALVGFNLGVEVAQIAVVALLWLITVCLARAMREPAPPWTGCRSLCLTLTAAITASAAHMLGLPAIPALATGTLGAALVAATPIPAQPADWRRAFLVQPASSVIATAGLLLATQRVLGL